MARRVLALACLVASLPAACLKYPWLPATVQEFAASRVDPYPSGTASYQAERLQRRERLGVALTLYALGTLSLVGLALIACGAIGRLTEAACWATDMVMGVGVVLFERPAPGPVRRL